VQLHQQTGSAVICPTHKPCCIPPPKILLIQKNLFMGVNNLHTNITV